MIEAIYFIIIAVLALLLGYNLLKKRPMGELICLAVVFVTFALRALHIK